MQMTRKVMLDDMYMLDGRTVVPAPDVETWGAYMNAGRKVIAQSEEVGWAVQTLFLGYDDRWGLKSLALPALFLTRAVGEGQALTKRATTYKEAERQHAEAVTLLREGTQKGRVCV